MAEQEESTLPLFRLAPLQLDEDTIRRFVARLELDNTRAPLPGGVRIGDDVRYLEAFPDSSYWFADERHLWKVPDGPLALPSEHDAEAEARSFVNALNLEPRSDVVTLRTSVATTLKGTTCTARLEANGGVVRDACVDIDIHVAFATHVVVRDPSTDEEIEAEAVGLGTKLGVTLGANKKIVGLHAAWRPIERLEIDAPWLPPQLPAFGPQLNEAAGERAIFGRPRLVYRVATLANGATCLCPFRLYPAAIGIGGRVTRTSDQIVPAARYQLADPAAAWPYRRRNKNDRPNEGNGRYSMGISWVTKVASHAADEVKLMRDQAAAAGWDVRFAWADYDAWITDWTTEAASWVDGADLAYYVGHASETGWSLMEKEFPLSMELDAGAVGRRGDPTGAVWSKRLKWVLIGACGPLQDKFRADQDGAFKWAGAFDGLRMLAGFATPVAGFTGEASKAFELAQRGVPLAKAWLRAARQAQPSSERGDDSVAVGERRGGGRWCAVLALETETASALSDVLPGSGRPLQDLTGSKRLRAIWIPI